MKTKSVIGFLILTLVSENIRGQENAFGFCSLPHYWDKVQMSAAELPPGANKMLIVTNRPYVPDAYNREYFPNEIAEYRKVSYMLAACDGEKWELSLADDLFSGLEQIDHGEDIVLFVHGHGKSLPGVLMRANQIRDRYGVALIVFDWPSNNSNFNKSLSRVRRCGENFYNLLLQLYEYRIKEMNQNQHLSMLMHSLGNYYLTHLVVNGNSQYMNMRIFDNIILNAPAVRSREHGEVISRINIQNEVYVAFNKYDKVLRGAHLLTSGKMLGNVVFEPLADNTTYLDFTPVSGTEHTYFAGYHRFEDELPAIGYFFSTALHGGAVDFSHQGIVQLDPEMPIYTIEAPDSTQ